MSIVNEVFARSDLTGIAEIEEYVMTNIENSHRTRTTLECRRDTIRKMQCGKRIILSLTFDGQYTHAKEGPLRAEDQLRLKFPNAYCPKLTETSGENTTQIDQKYTDVVTNIDQFYIPALKPISISHGHQSFNHSFGVVSYHVVKRFCAFENTVSFLQLRRRCQRHRTGCAGVYGKVQR